METWDLGRFLVQGLPQKVGSLRLTEARCISDDDVRAWMMQFIPLDIPSGATPPWKFRLYVIWEQSNEDLMLTLCSYACIALPKSARRWLEYTVRRHNENAPIQHVVIENNDGTLSLRISRSAELSAARVQLLAASNPPSAIVQPFFESYTENTELLLQAWKDGLRVGNAYRQLH